MSYIEYLLYTKIPFSVPILILHIAFFINIILFTKFKTEFNRNGILITTILSYVMILICSQIFIWQAKINGFTPKFINLSIELREKFWISLIILFVVQNFFSLFIMKFKKSKIKFLFSVLFELSIILISSIMMNLTISY